MTFSNRRGSHIIIARTKCHLKICKSVAYALNCNVCEQNSDECRSRKCWIQNLPKHCTLLMIKTFYCFLTKDLIDLDQVTTIKNKGYLKLHLVYGFAVGALLDFFVQVVLDQRRVLLYFSRIRYFLCNFRANVWPGI